MCNYKPQLTVTDKNGILLHEGDRVHDKYGYDLIVCRYPDDNGFYGRLVCEPTDSCADIPYHLNSENIELISTQN